MNIPSIDGLSLLLCGTAHPVAPGRWPVELATADPWLGNPVVAKPIELTPPVTAQRLERKRHPVIVGLPVDWHTACYAGAGAGARLSRRGFQYRKIFLLLL